MHQHLLLLSLLLFKLHHLDSSLIPLESTKVRQSFIGQNPENLWEQYRPGRVMMPTYRVNLYGQKSHQSFSKRFPEDEFEEDAAGHVGKHMYYAKSALYDNYIGF